MIMAFVDGNTKQVLSRLVTVVVPKCFIKHMCFFVLYFLKNVLYFCKLFKWVEYLFQVFIYNTKIGEL